MLDKFCLMLKNPKLILLYIMKNKPFHYLSDQTYLKIKYYLIMNQKLDLNEPSTFNEKLQWLKLFNRNSVFTDLVDKYEVRKFIEQEMGKEYLIPLYGVYDSFEQINFDNLPNKFVLKPTHTSGNVYICKDKEKIDYKVLKKEVNSWLKREYFWIHREWPYKNVKPRIIIEKFMENRDHSDLKDYKLMVFNGKVNCTLVISNRNKNDEINADFFDINWHHLPFGRPDREFSNVEIKKPENYNKMIYFAEKLSKKIPFVRVDFYEIDGKLFFGEMTFYPGAGFEKFDPEASDKYLGELLTLPEKTMDL